MQFRDRVHDALARLNSELARECDPGRVRFASIEPDPDYEGVWLVLATWELPSPVGDAEVWPLAQLDRYCALAADALSDITPSVECLFRTHDQLTASQLGEPIPELV